MNYDTNWPELCNSGFTDKIMDSDENYVYEAFAEPGTLAADPRWCVRRIKNATGSITWAGGSNELKFPAIDLPGLFA